MTWGGIYWHVWGACVVLQPTVQNKSRDFLHKSRECEDSDNHMISASDIDRYSVDSMGISVYSR